MFDQAEFNEDVKKVESLVSASRYEDAINLLISRVRECAEKKDTAGVDVYTAIARGALTTLESEFGATLMKPKAPGETECFVCGENSEAELVSGANGAICRKCTVRIYEYFSERRDA